MVDNVHSELALLAHQYKMPHKAKQLLAASNPLLLCGVTAAGKGTVASKLLELGGFKAVVSHTTRAPRANHGVLEQNGEEYWFVSEAEMLEMIKRGELLEVKDIHSGTFSGKSIFELDKVISHNQRPIFDIDVKGALEFVKIINDLKPIFLLPPSYDIWMERLGTRGSMTDIERTRRLKSAKNELTTALANSHFVLVINHEAELTAQEILKDTYSSPELQHQAHSLANDYLQFLKDI